MPESQAGKDPDSSDLTVAGMLDALRRATALYRGSFLTLLGLFLVVQLAIYGLDIGGALIATYQEDSQALLVIAQLTVPLAAAVIASYGFAVASRFLAARTAGIEATTTGASLAFRGVRQDIIVAGLYSSVLSLGVLLLFGQPLAGYLVPVFIGPPLLVQVVAIELKKMPVAIPRARELGSREWARLLMYLFTVALLLMVIQLAALILIGLVIGDFLAELSEISEALSAVAISRFFFALAWPILVCLQVVLYLDIRSRKDKLTTTKLTIELDDDERVTES